MHELNDNGRTTAAPQNAMPVRRRTWVSPKFETVKLQHAQVNTQTTNADFNGANSGSG